MTMPLPLYATGRGRLLNKRAQKATRERRAEAGRPDPAALDRAIADAVKECLAAAPAGRKLATALDPVAILKGTAEALRQRSRRAMEAGKDPIIYRPEAVAAALAARLGLEI